jgi:Protein of unknown function (DUF2786)
MTDDYKDIRSMFDGSQATAKSDSEKRAAILERIRGLIAQADSTPEPGEADVFRARADELMEKYTIDLWQVQQAQDGIGRRPEPEARQFDFSWFREHPRSSELWSLMVNTGWHCRVTVVPHSWRGNHIAVIGLPSDLDYFDMLFTHLMIEMGRKLLPHVDMKLSPGENAYNLRTANLGWPETAYELSKAGMLPWPKDANGVVLEGYKYAQVESRAGLAVAQKWRRAARKFYRDYIRVNGLESEPGKKPEVAARSYAQGFVMELATKMRNQEKLRRERPGDTSTALALRDIRQVVNEFADAMYPRPEGQSNGRAIQRSQAFDPNSYRRGTMDARDVDIVQHGSSRVGTGRGQLPS